MRFVMLRGNERDVTEVIATDLLESTENESSVPISFVHLEATFCEPVKDIPDRLCDQRNRAEDKEGTHLSNLAMSAVWRTAILARKAIGKDALNRSATSTGGPCSLYRPRGRCGVNAVLFYDSCAYHPSSP
jgi:hypothetical protein